MSRSGNNTSRSGNNTGLVKTRVPWSMKRISAMFNDLLLGSGTHAKGLLFNSLAQSRQLYYGMMLPNTVYIYI